MLKGYNPTFLNAHDRMMDEPLRDCIGVHIVLFGGGNEDNGLLEVPQISTPAQNMLSDGNVPYRLGPMWGLLNKKIRIIVQLIICYYLLTPPVIQICIHMYRHMCVCEHIFIVRLPCARSRANQFKCQMQQRVRANGEFIQK